LAYLGEKVMNALPLPSQSEINALFNSPTDVQPQTFELALVLGGTVSAGAYTAGAIDFLAEALDCFEAAKAAGQAPNYKVVLRTIAGTSGGAVNAAIAARAFNYKFPHVSASTLPGPADRVPNPFFEVWVNRLTLGDFLTTTDIRGAIPSLLNGKTIDAAAKWLQEYTAEPLAGPREWIAHPLTAFLTVTNLRGIPYKIEFQSGLTETFVNHADFVRFALHYSGRPAFEPRPDEFSLGFGDLRLPSAASWSDLAAYACASAAFPLGFPTRQLSRPLSHYAYRVVAVPTDKGGLEPKALVVDWPAMTGATGDLQPTDYFFSAVDGGVTDNEPIELARTSLSGIGGRNPRCPQCAHRAVFLIDPFAGVAPVTAPGVSGASKTAEATFSAVVQQTRYGAADLLLAADKSVYSRFMLTPSRDGRIGGDAIASAGLDAFLGFASKDFMIHDYLLGRYNCQSFLRKEFRLSADNTLFEKWHEPERPPFADKDGDLPIIPLFGQASVDETMPSWPAGKLDPEDYRAAIELRAKAILAVAEPGLLSAIGKPPGPLGQFVGWLARVGLQLSEQRIADFAVDAMKKSLQQSRLL